MKAFRVFYSTAGRSTRAIVLSESDSTLEKSLSLKDPDYRVGDSYSRITNKRELPLSSVPVKELSVGELFKLLGKEY
ncbi:hypothetical protein ACFU1R_24870 [Priestia megaterium]|uniref:hypothetical protein n=1 Tax=Priestia megaterium TaxID=1404 RepID=UPI00366F66D8